MTRRGSTLVIVTGLAMLMLSVSLAYLMRMRDSGQATAAVVHDAQARLMFAAAMAYISETSRIGWGSETFGWNDVRDHRAGPRTINGLLPHGADAWLASDTQWPAPGSVVRCPMYVMERPPFAIANTLSTNSIHVVPSTETAPDGGYRDAATGTAIHPPAGTAVTTQDRLADFSRLDPIPALAGPGEGLVQPLSAATLPQRYADFVTGDPTPRLLTREYGWFRVYRERPEDHDGSPNPELYPLGYVDPQYDTINLNGDDPSLPNVSIFVITAGSGATQGFRDFAEAQAYQPGLFLDAAHFAQVRANEVVLHFRVEWSAAIPNSIYNQVQSTIRPDHLNREGINFIGPDMYSSPPLGPFGTIRWTQRLDREPPQW